MQKRIQRVLVKIIYYGWAELESIGSDKSKVTTKKDAAVYKFSVYCATKSNAKLGYHASDTILIIYSDASYL